MKSATPSSKSATSKSALQYIKGVGPKLGMLLESRGFASVRDLFTFFPRTYEDRSKVSAVRDLQDGVRALVKVRVQGSRWIPLKGGYNRRIFEVRTSDGTGVMMLKWFHAQKSMENRFAPGTEVVASGDVKKSFAYPEMIHPETSIVGALAAATDGEPSQDFGRIVPIYTEIEGIPSRSLRKILWNAFQSFSSEIREDLPERLLAKYGFPHAAEAAYAIHFPKEAPGEIEALLATRALPQKRLIYEEFFKFQFQIQKRRLRMEREWARAFELKRGQAITRELQTDLPFTLTNGQKATLESIQLDLSQTHPMNRLVQGDVGSGKTVLAFLAAGVVIADGAQAALMAPTEILAEQHFRTCHKLLGKKLKAHLLTGKTPASERAAIFRDLAAGVPCILIGTHAVLEDPVVFKSLNLIIIDEQHRFGVEQRRTFRKKGLVQSGTKRTLPHALVLSATPIPRTLALTVYGDLAVSSIKELPPGRQPITTKVFYGKDTAAMMAKVHIELRAGRQAYFVFPLVSESEAEGFQSLKSAVHEAERLQHECFPEFKVGLLHGQMKPDEKQSVMDRFLRNEVQVLVSTTVIEVGVDCPNATIMVVEHAERFGLSQLHQLRGRVGRGSHASYCFLISHAKASETTQLRLDVLERTQDGFEIAEADLEVRGPGEFMGTRQSGGLAFKLASLIRDREILLEAHADVLELLRDDPEVTRPEHAPFRAYLEREGHVQGERLRTS